MDTYFRFLFEFLSVFFNGIGMIFNGLVKGIAQIFNIKAYRYVIEFYRSDLNNTEWILVVVAIIILILIVGLIGLLLFFVIRKYVRFRRTLVEQESLLEEVGKLHKEVVELTAEKEKILNMQMSQIGVNPKDYDSKAEEADVKGEEEAGEGEDNEVLTEGDFRFSKLHAIDLEYKDYQVQDYHNTFTLPELVNHFRQFCASKLRLYYSEEMIRLFISSLSATKLVILQGISGTGKTSLAYAWGKFIKNDAIIASVQPSWRDRTELFGYFNEFTKKFNETDVLRGLYLAGYTDDVYVTVLDEMNIARVEYYFAEMLSILEMPNRDEWIIELVPNSWKTDPKNIIGGKIKVPANMWYIGTINNDDSTFMVTDKVYDRAMPIDINDKGQVFEPVDTEAMNINSSYLEGLFKEAKENNPLTSEMENKINEMDDYVIKHFRIAFGNRIVMHMKKFVPIYVACGGDEVSGVDYFMARKVLRKFEQLNVSYIRDEIDGYIEFLDNTFGKGKMKECEEYLLRLKKLA